MVVRGEFSKGRAQVPFSERNDAVQAFLFHRANEPLGAAIDRAGVLIQRGVGARRRRNAGVAPRASPSASIFFTQERDNVGLLTMEPAAQDRD